MESPQLTEWEAKERSGLLALETGEWRQKRLVAENPETTSDVLFSLVGELICRDTDLDTEINFREPRLLTQAILAHPNTSADDLWGVIDTFYFAGLRAFCGNPAAPLLALEMPDFWDRFDEMASGALLREETLPPAVVHSLGLHEDPDIVQSARLHVAGAGPVQTSAEGRAALHANGFWEYAARHRPPFDLYYLRTRATFPLWEARLSAALHLPLTDTPIPDSMGESWNRSPLDLLEHLSRDGNRLVRWVAQTRLADPDFTFGHEAT